MAPKMRTTCLKSIGLKYVEIVGKSSPLPSRSSTHQAHRSIAREIKAYDTSLSPSFRSELCGMDMKHRRGSDLDVSSMMVVMSRSPAFSGMPWPRGSISSTAWLDQKAGDIPDQRMKYDKIWETSSNDYPLIHYVGWG